jgi:hypothetical protein
VTYLHDPRVRVPVGLKVDVIVTTEPAKAKSRAHDPGPNQRSAALAQRYVAIGDQSGRSDV